MLLTIGLIGLMLALALGFDAKTLREEFATLHTASNDLVKKVADEKRAFSGEEKEANEKRFSRMSEIRGLIDQHKQLAEMKLADIPEDKKENFQQDRQQHNDRRVEFTKEAATAALNDYLRFGRISDSLRQEFTLDSTSGSGVLIPAQVATPAVVRKNNNKIRAALAYRGYSPIVSTACVTIKVPTIDDDSNAAAAQSESATSQTVAEPTAAGISLDPTLYTSKGIWMSNTALMAPGFDAWSYLNPLLSQRIDLAQEAAAFTGIIASTPGKTAASATAITYAEVLDLEHSLKVAYRSDAVLFVSDGFYRLLRGLVDSQGRPLVEINPATQIETLHNYPIFITDNLEVCTAGKVVAAIASAAALFVYDCGGQRLARYTNYPARPDQTGFELFANGDSDFLAKGLKTLKMAAS